MKHLKPARKFFYGHALVRHGDGDWRCKCGEPLASWRVRHDEAGNYTRTRSTGMEGAREAMKLHRAKLWIAWNSQP